MRALQLVAAGTPLQERDVEPSEPAPGDVVIDIAVAGICRSDVHYRAGFPRVGPLPLTLGHEVAGAVAAVGTGVEDFVTGDRVCVHYQVGCGSCDYCHRGFEQFCPEGQMIGNGRPGGYAEQIVVPARNVIAVPEAVSLAHAAVMMCSSATSLHALRKGRLARGETVAIFGIGGLGMSAVQLAIIEGADRVYAVVPNPANLHQDAALGAVPSDPAGDTVTRIRENGPADVALDLVGSATVMRQCLDVLAPMGRAVAVGLTPDSFPVGPYTDLVAGESELIGASDHTAAEIVELLDLAAAGTLQLDGIVDRRVALEAPAVNAALDDLEQFGDSVWAVIEP